MLVDSHEENSLNIHNSHSREKGKKRFFSFSFGKLFKPFQIRSTAKNVFQHVIFRLGKGGLVHGTCNYSASE